MPADRRVRSQLFEDVIDYMKGHITGHMFAERNLKSHEDCIKSGDRSAGFVAWPLFDGLYDDFTDHQLSVTEIGWNILRHYAAFLKTELELKRVVRWQKHRGQTHSRWHLAILGIGLLCSYLLQSWPLLLAIWIIIGVHYQFTRPEPPEVDSEVKNLWQFAPFWNAQQWRQYESLLNDADLPAYDPHIYGAPWKRTRLTRITISWPSNLIKFLFWPIGSLWSLRPIKNEIYMVTSIPRE